ncbi:hypothetical protein DERP_012933 [Dermatophagoides pteronyssinus]|uniref:Uncharacterized protein n=1 Tax=Dermatophagoides pteronyssinus TaxID=6956 RepID=A0ABQ8J3L3_DERPT|nr:hypothetical protein DERP_012933 [Dermatophagoides pteronyssinus]
MKDNLDMKGNNHLFVTTVLFYQKKCELFEIFQNFRYERIMINKINFRLKFENILFIYHYYYYVAFKFGCISLPIFKCKSLVAITFSSFKRNRISNVPLLFFIIALPLR